MSLPSARAITAWGKVVGGQSGLALARENRVQVGGGLCRALPSWTHPWWAAGWWPPRAGSWTAPAAQSSAKQDAALPCWLAAQQRQRTPVLWAPASQPGRPADLQGPPPAHPRLVSPLLQPLLLGINHRLLLVLGFGLGRHLARQPGSADQPLQPLLKHSRSQIAIDGMASCGGFESLVERAERSTDSRRWGCFKNRGQGMQALGRLSLCSTYTQRVAGLITVPERCSQPLGVSKDQCRPPPRPSSPCPAPCWSRYACTWSSGRGQCSGAGGQSPRPRSLAAGGRATPTRPLPPPPLPLPRRRVTTLPLVCRELAAFLRRGSPVWGVVSLGCDFSDARHKPAFPWLARWLSQRAGGIRHLELNLLVGGGLAVLSIEIAHIIAWLGGAGGRSGRPRMAL